MKSWLETRRHYVGASEVGALFDIEIPDQPYLSRFALYHYKRGDLPPVEDNPAMRWGRRLEGPVFEALREDEALNVARWERCIGLALTIAETRTVLDTNPPIVVDPAIRASCTPDGFGEDPTGVFLVEAKTTNWRAWAAWREDFAARHDGCEWSPDHPNAEDVFPMSYLLQVTQQMGLTGIHRGLIAVLVDGRDLYRAWVTWQPDLWATMQARIAEFWADVDAGNEPAANTARSGDVEAIESLYRRKSKPVAEDWSDREAFAELVARYRAAQLAYGIAEKVKDQLQAELKAALVDGPIDVAVGTVKLNCGHVAPTAAKVVTEGDVGRYVAGFVEPDDEGNHYARKGYRMLRVTEPKGKK